jgi:hypothetical protein
MPGARLAAFLVISVVILAGQGHAEGPLPDPKLTPGAVNPQVTEQTIGTTICVRGWTRLVRPPESYTEPLKHEQIEEYGYRDRRLRDYEEDHLIPLELGGAPTDPRNLWPEPHEAAGDWGSYAKDRLESRLNELVCSGALPLDTARAAIASNWIEAYRRYVGLVPDNRPLHYNRYHRQ